MALGQVIEMALRAVEEALAADATCALRGVVRTTGASRAFRGVGPIATGGATRPRP